MNYEETLNYIHSLGKFRLPAGLERIKAVCEMLGNPQDNLKFIHIAGTNGKGSTAVMAANILKESGKRTGLFISPFVVCFEERIQINGEYISKEDLIKYSERVMDTNVRLNEFEFITAVAFLYFFEKGTDAVVLETGLGGRLDATNIIKNPLCSVITEIGLDHTAILGDTIEEIAAEKCGIIKNGNVVTAPNQNEKALSVIREYASGVFVPEMPEILSADLSGVCFSYKRKEFFVSLIGEHQALNAVTAISAVEKSGFDIAYETVKTALNQTRFAARLEIVDKNPLTVIDGAHNIDGAEVLARFLSADKSEKTLLIAMMKDKNCDDFLKAVLPYAKKVIVTKIDNPRCMESGELFALAKKYSQNVIEIGNLSDAVKVLKSSKTVNFIVGSLYLASEARKYYTKS